MPREQEAGGRIEVGQEWSDREGHHFRVVGVGGPIGVEMTIRLHPLDNDFDVGLAEFRRIYKGPIYYA